MKRYDIVFDIEETKGGENEIEMKVVTDKSFLEVAQFAESMVGKLKDDEKIIAVRKIRRYSDVDVI